MASTDLGCARLAFGWKFRVPVNPGRRDAAGYAWHCFELSGEQWTAPTPCAASFHELTTALALDMNYPPTGRSKGTFFGFWGLGLFTGVSWGSGLFAGRRAGERILRWGG